MIFALSGNNLPLLLKASCQGTMAGDRDKSSSTIEQVKDHMWEAADRTSKAVEEGIQAASYAVKSGTVMAKQEYSKAVESSQVNWCSLNG